MKPLESLRQKGFWIIDTIKGSPIKSQLEEVEFIMNHWGEPNVIEKQNEYLNSILNYVVDNVEFYKKYKGFNSLKDFPVVNKSIIKGQETLFYSPLYDMKKMFRQETSGSTGVPFVVYQNPEKRIRATADTLYFSKLAHYELGTRLYFSRVWDAKTTRSPWTCFKQNWVMHNASNLSDKDLSGFIETLEKDKSTKSVILFASTLAAIAKFVEINDLWPKCKVESFITISESLDSWTKKTIEKRFNSPVFSRYSNQELGIMGQFVEGKEEFLVNVASFYIEILDLEKDEPAKVGEEGRIVVTDLFNKAVPLIRYDTGDIAVLKPASENELRVPVFEKVGGRRVDYIFDTSDRLISPYVINTPMHEFLEISQYQFIQESANEYKMLLNIQDSTVFYRENDVVDMLKSYLGQDANIEIEYVKEIPVLKSGKRKQVVNNYKTV